jgi:hypothetical protein
LTTTIAKTGYTTITPLQVLGYESSQQTGNILHDIIGRSDVDVTFAAAGLRTGTLTFLFGSLATVLACRDLHASIGIVVLADSDLPLVGMKYVTSGSIVVSQDADRIYWTLAVDFQEVL